MYHNPSGRHGRLAAFYRGEPEPVKALLSIEVLNLCTNEQKSPIASLQKKEYTGSEEDNL